MNNIEARPIRIFIVALLLVTLLCPASSLQAKPSTTKEEVFFSPKGGCTQAVVDALGQAKQSVLVQAYSFTSYPIAKALIDAQKRGVKVEAIIDAKQIHEKKVKIGLLAKGGVTVYLDGAHAIAHNKVMVIDGKTVITGSFNFSAAAEEKNAENLLILEDPALAAEYTSNWKAHQKHSERYPI